MVFVTLKSQDTPEVIHNWFAVHLKRAVCLCLDGFLSGRSEACLSGDVVCRRGIFEWVVLPGKLPILTQYYVSNTLLFCQAGFATDHACTGVGFKLLGLLCSNLHPIPIYYVPISATPFKSTSTFTERVALDGVTLIGSLVNVMGHGSCVMPCFTANTDVQGRGEKDCGRELFG